MALSAYPAGLVRRIAAGVYDLFLLVGLLLLAGLALLPFNHGHAVDGHNPLVRLYFLFVPYLFFSGVVVLFLAGGACPPRPYVFSPPFGFGLLYSPSRVLTQPRVLFSV